MGLKITLTIIITRAVSLWLGGIMGSPEAALALFSGSGVIVYGYALLRFLSICGVSWQAGLQTVARSIARVLPYGVPIVLMQVLGASPLTVTLISFLALAAMATQLIWRVSRQPGQPWAAV